ncbi:MAG: SDR family NAD(P)-dependent oxidoreductase [Gemmatimonadaceae bacterium]
MDFQGRTVILTGVGRAGQVGEVVARAFVDRGARIALLDRDEPEVRARASGLAAGGASATAYPCDLTDAAAVERAAAQVAADAGGRAHALVNVAGGFAMSGPAGDADLAVLHRMLAINLVTAYAATRYFLPLLRAGAGDAGDAAVVYFASAAVLPGESAPDMSAYAAAKSGVLAVMRAVAAEERARGVRANAVAPTSIRTGDNLKAMGEGVRYVERESVADVVTWLCSPAARNVSGEVFRLE